MQVLDRIEKRRFVGREFLLWMWFESELFEATLETRKHGAFGLWIERQLVLSPGVETTRIKGSYPGGSREAKEALLVGKLPEAAGLHVSWGDREITFTLKAERMAVTGLVLPTVLDEDEPALAEALPPRRRKKGKGPAAEAREDDAIYESFRERMRLTQEIEELLEALYRDFLTLRLGSAWGAVALPAIRAWARGGKRVDADAYRKKRSAALAAASRRSAAR
jgi:hypothetical protein